MIIYKYSERYKQEDGAKLNINLDLSVRRKGEKGKREPLSFRVQILLLFCVIVAVYFFLRMFPYNYENFQFALSAISQCLATIFAVVISATLIVAQIVANRSPRTIEILPKKEIVLYSFFCSMTIIFDWLFLVVAPIEVNTAYKDAATALIIVNSFAILVIILYVQVMIDWMKPKTLIGSLVEKAKETDDIEKRKEIVRSLEEFAMDIANRRQLQTAVEILDAYSSLGHLFAQNGKSIGDITTTDLDHPLRLLPLSLRRVGITYAKCGLEDAVYKIADVYGKIGEEYGKHNIETNVEFSMSFADIVEACAKYELVESVVYNFIVKKEHSIVSLTKKGFHKVAWTFTWSIKEIGKICVMYHLRDASHKVAEEIVNIANAFAKHGCITKAPETLMYTIRVFRPLCIDAGINDYTGRYGNRTIGEALDAGEKILVNILKISEELQ